MHRILEDSSRPLQNPCDHLLALKRSLLPMPTPDPPPDPWQRLALRLVDRQHRLLKLLVLGLLALLARLL